VGFLGGVALLVLLGGKLGSAPLLEALTHSATPIACASIYHLVPLALHTQGWRLLLPGPGRPSFLGLLHLRWMGESINSLLPVAQVGGDVARASRLVTAGVPAPDAGASMIGDLGLGVLAQIVFTVVGLLALGAQARVTGLGRPIALGLAFVVAVGAAGIVVVRLGVNRIASRLPLWRALTTQWKGPAGGAARLDAALRALVARRRKLAASFGWHLVGWLSQVGETWLVLALAGTPIGWGQALVIESLAATARGAAFFVPGGLGVQEAAVVGVCRYLGLPAEGAVALGLIKRMREILMGLPGLALWAYTERGLAPRKASLPPSEG
jgi:putative membrane protein